MPTQNFNPGSAILDCARLLQVLKSGYRLDWEGVHGLPHWRRVEAIGRQLVLQIGADLRVVELFAFLHGCRRLNVRYDAGYGPRLPPRGSSSERTTRAWRR